MASSKTKRRSRKARAARPATGPKPSGAAAPGIHQSAGPAARGDKVTPKVAVKATPQSNRRARRDEREREAARQSAMSGRSLGTYGERPNSIFHPVPVSEIAIFAGLVSVVVGIVEKGGPALTIGAIVCGLGVFEFTAREHFTGYRSHSTLLAAFPAVIVEVLIATLIGVPNDRALLLAPVIPVFALGFWLSRTTFQRARYARVARPPVS